MKARSAALLQQGDAAFPTQSHRVQAVLEAALFDHVVQVCQDQLRYRAFANDGTIVEWIAHRRWRRLVASSSDTQVVAARWGGPLDSMRKS